VRFEPPGIRCLLRQAFAPWRVYRGKGAWISAFNESLSGSIVRHYLLHAEGIAQPVLTLRADGSPSVTGAFTLSNDGRFVAWSNSDGPWT
jgi:hypothetical protein